MEKDYQPPELFSHKISSGDKLYGMMFKPKNMVVGRKYPVMLSVYGGPEVQLVTNTFKVFFILFKFIWKMDNSSNMIHLLTYIFTGNTANTQPLIGVPRIHCDQHRFSGKQQ